MRLEEDSKTIINTQSYINSRVYDLMLPGFFVDVDIGGLIIKGGSNPFTPLFPLELVRATNDDHYTP